MKKVVLLTITIIYFFNFLSCKGELSLSYPPITPQDTTFLEKNISEAQAIKFGDDLIAKQVPISKFEGEVYAHDSKLLIVNDIVYCVYYGNDVSTQEGVQGQSIRCSIFNINKPQERKVFDVFKENEKYSTLLLDKNTPTYTPMIFLTKDNKIRISAKVYTLGQQKYYYRDYDPNTQSFSDPQICKLYVGNDKNTLFDFDINNVRKHLKFLFGEKYDLSTEWMFATSEPMQLDGANYLGLTIGRFTANWRVDEGTTILMKTKDDGKSFELLGAPDGRGINSKYCRQIVEAAFDAVNSNEILMIGRNSLGGIMLSQTYDGGLTFVTPYSLNDACGFNTMPSKPLLIRHDDGFISVWNTTENVGSYNVRTTLEIRYGKDNSLCGNPIKVKFKHPYGCHYPSIFYYKNNYYMSYTTDSRRFNKNSTGEIAFVKLPF